MRPNVRHQIPLASAVLLSVAAGLSLAEEHIGPATASPEVQIATNARNGQGKASSSVKTTSNIKAKSQASSRPTPQTDGTIAKERGTDQAGTGDGGQAKSTGVGSRALMGNEAPGAADQPEMATGVDLKGPPCRFPADDTPE